MSLIINFTPIMKRIFCCAIILITLVAMSCKKDNEPSDIVFAEKRAEIPGHGGEYTFELKEGNWEIISIINNQGNLRMFGDSRTLDGELISQNKPLALAGFGSLESVSSSGGFKVFQEQPGSIRVLLLENRTKDPFSFKIVLQKENITQEIQVAQPTSEGYTFDKIEYFIGETDRDSIYVREHTTTYDFDFIDAQEVQIYPFSGLSEVTSYFESTDPDAFVWLVDDALEVQVPEEIIDGKIYLSHHKVIFGDITKSVFREDYKAPIKAPAGRSQFSKNVEGRRRQVTFKISMTSNSTGNSKEVTGKWIETSPTGKYEIIEIK